jgi:type I restriction enzyme S subunit
MGVKAGYKQTEVGEIPEDWEVKKIGEICGFIVPGRNKPKTFSGNIPWITTPDLVEGRLISASRKDLFVTKTEADSIGSKIIPPGSILLSCAGELGIVALTGNAMVINQQLHAFLPPENASATFLLNELWFQRDQIYGLATKTAVPYLNKTNCNSIKIPLPPTLTEQEAIAAALSDADALIEALEQVIAKKRIVKQGAIQELLTGKRRLPGFSGEWETKQLGEIGEISSAGVDKKIRPDEVPIRLVNYLDVYRKDFIYSKDLNHWVTARPQQAIRCTVQKGDVFFTPTSETRDDIGISSVAMEDIPDAAYSYHVTRLRLHEPWDLCFRTYAFKTRAFLNQAETLCDGNGTRYVISQGKFRSMTVQVPPLPEQSAIASILSDMDAEIAALEGKLAKARRVKEGMMRELLTGRIRLV